MFSIYNKYNQEVKIYAETIEDEAVSQIYNMANSPLGKDANIRIMPDCLSEDTEVLTPIGFKLITSLNHEDKIANYDPISKKIFFSNPKNIIIRSKREDEKIFEYFNKQHGFSFIVSENHRMAILDQMGEIALNIPQTKMKEMIFNGQGLSIVNKKYSNNEVRLIAWIVGDGNIKTTNNITSLNQRIRFGLKKERKINRLLELLKEEKINYSISKSDKQTEIYFNTVDSKKFINWVGENKNYPLDFYSLDYEQSMIFLEEAIQIDGDYESYINNRGYRISSKRKEDIDLFSAIIGINYGYGKISKKKDQELYYINAISNEKLKYSKSGIHNRVISRTENSYSGFLVCIECDSSFFIARQKGLVFITGNCHAGKGCTIGTTMLIKDKVCPNIVGVDIGCGVTLLNSGIENLENRLQEFDKVIRREVPFGHAVHKCEVVEERYFSELRCWHKLSDSAKKNALHALGTLGGGNHFIEAYGNGTISVHSGSRNLGLQVAKYYQNLAEIRFRDTPKISKEELDKIDPKDRTNYIAQFKGEKITKELMWLEGQDMEDYLSDMNFMERFASNNRKYILMNIVHGMMGDYIDSDIINSTHNYIDKYKILRKGAIQAYREQLLVIPLSMRDGLLVCKGKGNEDWNYSAPHGAGRLYSRSKAKELFKLEDYQKEMEGIFSTCINNSTIDEAPFAYKDYQEIMRLIEPTVEILERLVPIFNFKAN